MPFVKPGMLYRMTIHSAYRVRPEHILHHRLPEDSPVECVVHVRPDNIVQLVQRPHHRARSGTIVPIHQRVPHVRPVCIVRPVQRPKQRARLDIFAQIHRHGLYARAGIIVQLGRSRQHSARLDFIERRPVANKRVTVRHVEIHAPSTKMK